LRIPEDIDLGAIKADLEFLIERVTRFRKEQALKPLYTMIGRTGIVIAWIELFWRHCLWAMQVFWSLTAIASLFAIVFIATRWLDEDEDGACCTRLLHPVPVPDESGCQLFDLLPRILIDHLGGYHSGKDDRH
jgi:hypothetical protein